MNYERFFWQHRELEKALSALRPMYEFRNVFSPSFTSHIRELQMLAGRFTLPAPYLGISGEIQKAVDLTRINQSFRKLASLDLGVTKAFIPGG